MRHATRHPSVQVPDVTASLPNSLCLPCLPLQVNDRTGNVYHRSTLIGLYSSLNRALRLHAEDIFETTGAHVEQVDLQRNTRFSAARKALDARCKE